MTRNTHNYAQYYNGRIFLSDFVREHYTNNGFFFFFIYFKLLVINNYFIRPQIGGLARAQLTLNLQRTEHRSNDFFEHFFFFSRSNCRHFSKIFLFLLVFRFSVDVRAFRSFFTGR